jgi:ATP-binding cassette subfamily B protein
MNNIAVGESQPDHHRIHDALDTANLSDFVNSLPFGLYTRIGAGGHGISQGQKQRLFIARAVYKDPAYLFFDEATNSLDSNNEKVIMDNLDKFVRGKTVVVVAHRLSTVRHADNIVVLEKGRIIEQGNHEQLTSLKGAYFSLVKNQLELGV